MDQGNRPTRIAVLVASGVNQEDLSGPLETLSKAGVNYDIISPEDGRITTWLGHAWGEEVDIDVRLDRARAEKYDVLFLPGGRINPEALRENPKAVEFVCEFFESGKPVAALCQGPWFLVDAGLAHGERNNSYYSSRTSFAGFVTQLVDEVRAEDPEGNPLPILEISDQDPPPKRRRREPDVVTIHAPQEMIVWRNRGPRRPPVHPTVSRPMESQWWVMPV